MRWSNIVLLFALWGCGSAPVFNTSHEVLGTMAGRTTYAFAPVEELGEEGFTTGHLFNPIMERRIRDELTRELSARGYVPTAAESASLLVTFSGGGKQEVEAQGKQEGSVVRGPAYTVDRGALVLHFLDPKSKTVVWRGWGDGVMQVDDDFDQKVRAAVRKIMAAFPVAAASVAPGPATPGAVTPGPATPGLEAPAPGAVTPG
jgi:hypothetical protein